MPPACAPRSGRSPSTALQREVESRNRERMPFTTTLDSIRTLGGATNGLAIVDSNDVRGGLQRIADDFNAYYLLGYTSSNGKADGNYRTIKVTVKRPGVQVRAREGYLARRIDERAVVESVRDGRRRLTQCGDGAPRCRVEPADAGAGGRAAGRVRRRRCRGRRHDARDPRDRGARSGHCRDAEWADGGEAQAFVRDAKGEIVTTGKAVLPKGARTVEIEVPIVEGLAGDVKVQVRVSGTGPLARYTDTTSVALDAMPAGWGAPRLSRRGPSTGVAWVPTADPRFRRQERLRVSVGLGPEAGTVTGTLLDRQGKPINVPVKIDQSEPAALVAELALAPLAAGDYVLALGAGGSRRLLVPLRIVP